MPPGEAGEHLWTPGCTLLRGDAEWHVFAQEGHADVEAAWLSAMDAAGCTLRWRGIENFAELVQMRRLAGLRSPKRSPYPEWRPGLPTPGGPVPAAGLRES